MLRRATDTREGAYVRVPFVVLVLVQSADGWLRSLAFALRL